MAFIELGNWGTVLRKTNYVSASSIRGGTITGQTIIVGGGTNGVIRSENYVASTTGWAIFGDGTADLAGLSVSGAIQGNWDGTDPANLATVDGGATTGYYLDSSVGSAQFMGDIFLGGNLTLEGGSFRTASSGQRIVIFNNETIDFYTGLAAEVTNGYIWADDTTDTANPRIRIQSPSITGISHSLDIASDGVTILRNTGTAGTQFNVTANAYGLTATIGPVTIVDLIGGSNTNSLNLGTYISLQAGSSIPGSAETIFSSVFAAETGAVGAPTYTFTPDPIRACTGRVRTLWR